MADKTRTITALGWCTWRIGKSGNSIPGEGSKLLLLLASLMIAAGELPVKRIGTRVLISRRALEKFAKTAPIHLRHPGEGSKAAS
jgi:hypothetical protein